MKRQRVEWERKGEGKSYWTSINSFNDIKSFARFRPSYRFVKLLKLRLLNSFQTGSKAEKGEREREKKRKIERVKREKGILKLYIRGTRVKRLNARLYSSRRPAPDYFSHILCGIAKLKSSKYFLLYLQRCQIIN